MLSVAPFSRHFTPVFSSCALVSSLYREFVRTRPHVRLKQAETKDNLSRPFLTLPNVAIGTFISYNNLTAGIAADLRYVRFLSKMLSQGAGCTFALRPARHAPVFCHHALTSIELNNFIDNFVDPIDQAPLTFFLFYFCVCPSWPLYKARLPPLCPTPLHPPAHFPLSFSPSCSQAFLSIRVGSTVDEYVQYLFMLLS